MIVAIDASNLLGGGCRTHLKELLKAMDPHKHGFSRVIVFAPHSLISDIPVKPWLLIESHGWLNRSIFFRNLWQFLVLPIHLKRHQVSILFSPGGHQFAHFHPHVSMSRNMLVFDEKERARYFPRWMYWRLKLLEKLQSKSFKTADGLIFLSEYAQKYITESCKLHTQSRVIHHGISSLFKQSSTTPVPSNGSLIRFVYVSSIDTYKHQPEVCLALNTLRERGWNIQLDLIGPAYHPSLKALERTWKEIPDATEWIHWKKMVPHSSLPRIYQSADILIYASSCENMPNILIECMASGKPIACSNTPPLPEFAKEAAWYFNPESVESITATIEALMKAPDEARQKSELAFKLVQNYSWDRCASETFDFLKNIHSRYQSNLHL